MRIDDENKVVWCSEELLEWYESFEGDDKLWIKISRIRSLSNCGFGYLLLNGEGEQITELYGEDEAVLNDDKSRLKLIGTIANNYEFKLEQPKKYYWRKKKEHLAWFENPENFYLTKDFIEKVGLDNLENEGTYKWYKFSEDLAKNLLKHDFDKFEKVECE